MALNSSRSALSSACKALRQCRAPTQAVARPLAAPVRQFSSSARRTEQQQQQQQLEPVEEETNERPRWSYTPERMKMPFSINIPKKANRSVWKCNDRPDILDAMYKRFLGSSGDKMLPEEVKWLAVTHKSFDQGRRGFNTRLAYYGMSIGSLPSFALIEQC